MRVTRFQRTPVSNMRIALGNRVQSFRYFLMIEKNLHSLETYLYKYLLPLLFIPWDGFRSMNAAFPSSDPTARTTRLIFYVFWFVMTPYVFWYGFKLKRVILLDDRFLRIKGYLKEIEIPLSDVESVTKSRWPRTRHVKLRLKARSEFSDKIWFIPKGQLETLGKGSTLEELQQLIGMSATSSNEGSDE